MRMTTRQIGESHSRWTGVQLGRTILCFVAPLFAAVAMTTAAGAEQDDGGLLQRVKAAQHSLLAGVAEAEKQHGAAISAKFEMEDRALMLSVYTAQAGLAKDAEHNVLMEVIGDANKPSWTPKVEIFEDKEHLKRSAMQLTLVQVSTVTLSEAIKKAQSAVPGTVYSAIPAVRKGTAVFEVKVATPEGRSVQAIVDGKTAAVDASP